MQIKVKPIFYHPMKIFKLFIFALCFSLTVQNAFSQTKKVNKENYSLLWKIESDSVKKSSYLFGTMHLKDKRVFEFSDSVLVKFYDADVLTLEVNFDSMAVYQFKKSIAQAETKTFYREIFTDEELEKIEGKTKNTEIDWKNIKNKNLREIEDWFERYEDKKSEKMPVFLDAYLFTRAKDCGIKVVGLENYEEHLKLYDSLSLKVKKEFITSQIDSFPNFMLTKEEMITIYREGNIEKISTFINLIDTGYRDEIIEKRNINMVNALEPLLKENSVFTAVGAAHLQGEKGMIELLKRKGYKVTPVNASFTGIADSLLEIEYINAWEKYIDTVSGFSLDVPCKPLSFSAYGGMIDMKVAYDLSQGPVYYFYAIPAPYASVGDDPAKLMEVMVERFNKIQNTGVISKKKVEFKGIKGIEVKLRMNYLFEVKVKIFLVNNHVYFFMVGNTEKDYNSDKAERFFNSLVFFEPEEKEPLDVKDWQEFSNETAAFSVLFPTKSFYQNQDVPDPDDPEAPMTKLHIHYSMNAEKQEVYLLRWNNLPVGYYYDNDSNVFQAIFSSLFGEDYVFDPDKTKTFVDGGTIGYEPAETRIENDFEFKVRTYLRGNRIYLLMAQGKKGNLSTDAGYFFDSFKPLPFLPSSYTTQKIDELSILFPSKPVLSDEYDDNNYSWAGNISYRTYSAGDENSGLLYSVKVQTLPKYYRITSIDSFYVGLEDAFVDYDQRVTDISTGYLDNGLYYRKGTIISDLSENKTRYMYFLKGNKSFEVYAFSNLEKIQDSLISSVFLSAGIDEFTERTDLFSSKWPEILSNLKSGDSLAFHEAKKAFDYYQFDSTEIDLLYDALSLNFQDSVERYGIKEKILYVIEELHDERAPEILSELYLKDKMYDGHIISTLNEIVSDKEAIFSLLKEKTPQNIMYYQSHRVLSGLFDSSFFYKIDPVLLSDICAGNQYLHRAFLKLICEKWDSLNLEDIESSGISGNVIKWYNIALDSISKYTPDSTEFYDFEDIITSGIDFFRHLNNSDYDELVKKIDKFDYTGFQSKIIEYNLSRNFPIKPSLWKKVMKDESTGWQLIESLNGSGNFGKIPPAYVKEEHLALLALKDYFYYDDYVPEHIELLEMRNINRNGKMLKYYIFEFSYEGSPEKYLAISGGFEKTSTKLILDNMYCDYSYNEIKNKGDKEKEIQQLVRWVVEE